MARRATYKRRRVSGPKKTTLGPGKQTWSQPKLSGPSTLGGSIPKPPTPAAPRPQAQPIDPIYTGQMGLINRNRQDIYAEYGNPFAAPGSDFTTQYGYQGGRLASDYGFIPGSQTIDPNNPYSRASLLQRSFQQGQQGTTNSMASRGQLYSGATQRGLDEGTFQYQRGSNDLSRGYTDALRGLTRTATEGLSGLSREEIDAGADRIDRAPDPVVAPPVVPVKPKAPAKPKAKPKKKRVTWRNVTPKKKTRLG